MTPRPLTRPELKAGIRELLERDPQAFFNILREVRDELYADPDSPVTAPTTDEDPYEAASTEDKIRAEIEADLAILADFFRGFA